MLNRTIERFNIPQVLIGFALGIVLTTLIIVIVMLISLQELQQKHSDNLDMVRDNLVELQSE
jgi:hypothetical protein